MKKTIRPATIKDLNEILELNKYLFEFERQFGKTYNLDWTFSPKGKQYFQKRIEKDLVLVYQIDEQIVGYLCGFSDNYSFRSVNPIFEIENMFVSEKFRHQNIGSRLIAELQKVLKQNNIKRIRVGTMFDNQQATGFYQKNGFLNHELILEKQL